MPRPVLAAAGHAPQSLPAGGSPLNASNGDLQKIAIDWSVIG